MQMGINNLSDAVICAINGIEAGSTKKEAARDIAAFVEANYIDMSLMRDFRGLTIADVENLHSRGIAVVVHDGQIIGFGVAAGQ